MRSLFEAHETIEECWVGIMKVNFGGDPWPLSYKPETREELQEYLTELTSKPLYAIHVIPKKPQVAE